MAPLLADPICAIFNASVRQGHVSNRWKLANVVSVPKVHPPKDIRSYLRPISLTPTLAKFLNLSWVRGFLECIEDKLGRDQFGALKRRSTAHTLISMTHLCSCALDKGDSARVLFIDYTKAFDHLDYTILLNKLISLDVPHCLVKWMFPFSTVAGKELK